jgi:hypothetical protein
MRLPCSLTRILKCVFPKQAIPCLIHYERCSKRVAHKDCVSHAGINRRSLLPLLERPLFRLHFSLFALPARAHDCTFTKLAPTFATLHQYLHSPIFQPLAPLPTLSTHNTTLNIANAQHHKRSTDHTSWPTSATPATPPAATTTVIALAPHHSPHHAVARTQVALSRLLRRSRN